MPEIAVPGPEMNERKAVMLPTYSYIRSAPRIVPSLELTSGKLSTRIRSTVQNALAEPHNIAEGADYYPANKRPAITHSSMLVKLLIGEDAHPGHFAGLQEKVTFGYLLGIVSIDQRMRDWLETLFQSEPQSEWNRGIVTDDNASAVAQLRRDWDYYLSEIEFEDRRNEKGLVMTQVNFYLIDPLGVPYRYNLVPQFNVRGRNYHGQRTVASAPFKINNNDNLAPGLFDQRMLVEHGVKHFPPNVAYKDLPFLRSDDTEGQQQRLASYIAAGATEDWAAKAAARAEKQEATFIQKKDMSSEEGMRELLEMRERALQEQQERFKPKTPPWAAQPNTTQDGKIVPPTGI